MSSAEVLLRYKNGGRHLWDCCGWEKPVQNLMGNTKPSLFPCGCEGCPISMSGVLLDGSSNPLNNIVSTMTSGVFALDSVDVLLDSQAILFVQANAISGTSTVTSVSFIGDTISVPPIVPFDIMGSQDIAFAELTTDTIGSFEVQIEIQTNCGTVTFVQPYVVQSDVEMTGVARQDITNLDLNAPIISQEGGVFILDSIDVPQGTPDYEVQVVVVATIPGSPISITDVQFSGDTIAVPPGVPIAVVAGSPYTVAALLDASTVGTMEVQVVVEASGRTWTYIQPYNVIDTSQSSFVGVARNLISNLNGTITTDGSSDSAGAYNFLTLVVAQNATDIILRVTVSAIVNDLDILDIQFSGNTLSVPPSTPYTILEGNSDAIIASLDTSTVGSFFVDISIEVNNGVFIFHLPYTIV